MKKLLLTLAFATAATAAQAKTDINVLARTCNGCHGVNGVSAGQAMPSIGGLPKQYLSRVMKQWKNDERSAITMTRVVKGFSDDEIDMLADYFSKQPWVSAKQTASPETIEKGKAEVLRNCTDCHGKAGSDPDVDAPKINGQWAKYMELEIEKFRSSEFIMPHRKMKKAVLESKPQDAAAAARYLGAQSQ